MMCGVGELVGELMAEAMVSVRTARQSFVITAS